MPYQWIQNNLPKYHFLVHQVVFRHQNADLRARLLGHITENTELLIWIVRRRGVGPVGRREERLAEPNESRLIVLEAYATVISDDNTRGCLERSS